MIEQNDQMSFVHHGCFQDASGDLLSFQGVRTLFDECLDGCRGQGYAFFGMDSNDQCLCIDDSLSPIAGSCSDRCQQLWKPPRSDLPCGGGDRSSVYSLNSGGFQFWI